MDAKTDGRKTAPLCLLEPSHPMIQSAADEPPEVVADWLVDRDATLYDAARLYAGTQERHYADGIPREALACWLERNGPAGSAGRVRGVRLDQYKGRPFDDRYAGFYSRDARDRPVSVLYYDIVRHHLAPGGSDYTDYHNLGGAAAIVQAVNQALDETGHDDRQAGDRLQEIARREVARARRDLKRRVLSLPCFASLTMERECQISMRELVRVPTDRFWEQVVCMAFRYRRARPDLAWACRLDRRLRRLVVRQFVPAAEWVPLLGDDELALLSRGEILARGRNLDALLPSL